MTDEQLSAYAERVKQMTPKQRAATLANHLKTKASDRWLTLPSELRDDLDAMAALLIPESEGD